MGPAAPQHVGSSRTSARTRVPRVGRRILNHCATREVPQAPFLRGEQLYKLDTAVPFPPRIPITGLAWRPFWKLFTLIITSRSSCLIRVYEWGWCGGRRQGGEQWEDGATEVGENSGQEAGELTWPRCLGVRVPLQDFGHEDWQVGSRQQDSVMSCFPK